MPTLNDMTTTSQQITDGPDMVSAPTQTESPSEQKKLNSDFYSWINHCKTYKRKLIPNWNMSIDYRRGKPLTSQPDEDQIAVNLDWSLTKTKQAALFSQVPQIRISHHPDSAQAGPWLAAFEKKVNDTFVRGGIEAAVDECLPDCINAAGIGVAFVCYEAITVNKQVPKTDPNTPLPDGAQPEMDTVPQFLDKRYVIQRISPADFLWPVDFTGSNFDNAPWLGRTGRIPWAEAVRRFKLNPADKEKYLGEDRTDTERLQDDVEREKLRIDGKVGFDEIYYKEHSYNPEAQNYDAIHHLVFLHGKAEPVVDEPWQGQRIDPTSGQLIGSLKNPIRVLTLTYITDDTIPPSDSAIGRPQVNEINKARTQMIRQRDRSIPIRWFDVNRLDALVQQGLLKGTWQNMIPVQGDGTRVIGEVSRAQYPSEDFAFDKVAKSDLNEAWTIGPNQQGSGSDVETKGESKEIAQGFQTRIGRERAKVASFVVGIATVLGGLLCLYEDPSTFGQDFNPAFSRSLDYSILADSTVLVDANQRLERLNGFLNTYAKSGWVVVESVLREIATLTGLDPNTVIKAPDPKPPVEPNISLRLTGAEDMMNPLLLAFMLQSGQAPKPELIEMAKKLIQQAVVDPSLAPPQPPMGPDGGPVPAPEGGPTPTGEANPQMNVLPKITKRSGVPMDEAD